MSEASAPSGKHDGCQEDSGLDRVQVEPIQTSAIDSGAPLSNTDVVRQDFDPHTMQMENSQALSDTKVGMDAADTCVDDVPQGPDIIEKDLQTMQEEPNQALNDTDAKKDEVNGDMGNDVGQDLTFIKEEDSESEFLWAKMQEHNKPPDSDSDSDDERPPVTKKTEPKNGRVTINDNGDEVIEILDSDGEGFVVPVKQEPYEPKFDWKSMPNEVIMLSDVENDVPGRKIMPNIKQEKPEVKFLWSEMGDYRVIDLSDSDENLESPQKSDSAPVLGNSLLQRPNGRTNRVHMDPERLREIQRLYVARAMEGRRRTSAGAGGIFSVPRSSNSDNVPQGVNDLDSNAWMHAAPADANDTASNFEEIKRQYRAKKKAKTDTIEDEIVFKKAQDAERARLRRLEARMYQIDSSDEEAEQSDDGLFIPESTPPFSNSKRRNLGDETEDGDDEGRRSKDSKSKRQKNSAKPLRTKSELRSELYHNLMAGYEEEAAKDRKKAESEAKQAGKNAKTGDKTNKKAQTNSNSKHTQELMKGKKPGSKTTTKSNSKSKRKPMTVRNLKTTNIYEESNANLAKLSMPTMSGKEKKKAMANLIASIPIDESKKAQARSDKTSILAATATLRNCKVNENRAEGTGDWILKGLTTPLFHYQVQGAAKMKEKEDGEKPPLGGILADEMGLGKTITCIACMVANQPDPAEEQRCTLIICSPAIINQWDDEIKKHTKSGILGGILRHHGGNRVSSKGASGRDAISVMEKAGVVLSTYSEVIKSYPKCDIPEHLTMPLEKMGWWKNEWETERGILHRVQFYRVILDESQVIKNHRSYTSIACRALMAKYRWAISGTPIQNSLEEIYPYFKFLRIPYTGSFRIFKHNFCDPRNDSCTKRLHSYMDHMMIRRTHQDEVLGTAILKLPKAHQETKYLKFNEIERHIYSNIRKRFIKLVNIALSDSSRTEEDQCKLVLLMVLRLRQITSHLFMLQEFMENYFLVEFIENFEFAKAEEGSPMSESCNVMANALKMMLRAKDEEPVKEPNAEKTKKGKNEPELIFKYRKLLRSLKDSGNRDELKDRSFCPRCKLPAEEPMLTSCLHLYCFECLTSLSHEASQMDQDHSRCLKCKAIFPESIPCPGLKELDMTDASEYHPKTSRARKLQGIFNDNNRPERPKRSLNDTMKWIDRDNSIIHSTKTAAVTEKLEQWLREFPKEKIIVFSQFHLLFHILGKECEYKKWKHCYYNGKMSHKAREDAIEKFRDDPDMKIMIASLKCGGIGLNLTMASRVICVDLWFNSSVEQQAFCRVLRIGQKQETHITRFVVMASIDQRLIQLQKYKDRIISAAIDERTVLAKLTLHELLSLFGAVGHDADARPFIYAEEETKNWGTLNEREVEVVEVEVEEPREDVPMEGPAPEAQ